jgi:hypothetical protein
LRIGQTGTGVDDDRCSAQLLSMRHHRQKWLPSGGGLAGFLAATITLFFIGIPTMAIVVMSGGGCEGKPRPCEPDNTALYVALVLLALVLIGVWWAVRRLVNSLVHGK